MKIDPVDGKPLEGIRRDMLGVRPLDPNNKDPKRKFDVDAVLGTDPVVPGTKKGLSVFSTAEECRTGTDVAVWEIDVDDLSAIGFSAVPDPPPNKPKSTHHVLEPSHRVTFDEYQDMLVDTRDLWVRVP
jgi:hypothetical protein